MSGITMFDYQSDAIDRMKNGCVLCGGVGSGKSRTSLAYYYILNGGKINTKEYVEMKKPKDLYIITTARKRDTGEWEGELLPFHLSSNPEFNPYHNTVVIDSWNNIKKYKEITGSFFIFDEQRVVGSGTWVKAFLRIARRNKWILLSATPGDTWSDYIPLFVANGFYTNKTQFLREHAVYSRYTKYPKIEKYINTGKLIAYRNSILVNMDFSRRTISHHSNIYVDYDFKLYKEVGKKRWDPYKNEPITNPGALCYIWRKVVNSDESRIIACRNIVKERKKCIIFYNFDYERDILKSIPYGDSVQVSEWSGHLHEPVPIGDSWVYLVQYTAGCEGWNCITTDTIIFFSQNYSYKVMAQAAGRIDRLNTPYTHLYYYHLMSRSGIDLAISKALSEKKNFNEGRYVQW